MGYWFSIICRCDASLSWYFVMFRYYTGLWGKSMMFHCHTGLSGYFRTFRYHKGLLSYFIMSRLHTGRSWYFTMFRFHRGLFVAYHDVPLPCRALRVFHNVLLSSMSFGVLHNVSFSRRALMINDYVPVSPGSDDVPSCSVIIRALIFHHVPLSHGLW